MSDLIDCSALPHLCRSGFAPFHQLAESLGNAVDARDAYTALHSTQVADISHRLSLAMGLTAVEANSIHLAGHLHDIGKIGIPDAILRKEGRLSQEEWHWMRSHPEIGARILAPVEGFNTPGGISDIVRAHHEKFDGSGYPDGLAGEAIPLGARIVAVSDCLSALIQDRPYRRGGPLRQALEEIDRCSATQFDPAVVKVLLQHRDAIMKGIAITPGLRQCA